MHEEYLSLSTQIEETISYKYWIVICNQGHRYYAIKLCFWCSHLECSDSCLNVSLFCEFCSWGCDWAKGLFCYFWLCDFLILVFATILWIMLTYLAWEEIIKLYLHNFSSHMSTLSVALQFDERWNIIWSLKFYHRWLHQWNLGSVAPIFIGYLPIYSKA